MPEIAQGQYLITPPTLSNGAVAPLQVSATGALKVSIGDGAAITTTTSDPTPVASYAASATLPASGAFTTPTAHAVPDGMKFATFEIAYTRGAASGYATHKVYLGDGTNLYHAPAYDGGWAGIDGETPADGNPVRYLIGPVDLRGGATHVGLASAEEGVTGTPGTCAVSVTFGA